MAHPAKSSENKHQARTRRTQSRILDAAQSIFAEQGFENTQLEQVATRAGYTRGAIYAHYASKEDLFLALLEQRVYNKLDTMQQLIEAEPELKNRMAIFKHWLAGQVCDPSWATLNLEFKLYALRRPQSRKKLQRLYRLLSKSSRKQFVELLYGKGLTEREYLAAERRLTVMGAVLSAVVLESHFRPDLLPAKEIQSIVETLLEAMPSR
jgi:AcrR family transcriptional regulator